MKKVNPVLLMKLPARTMREVEQDGQDMLDAIGDLPEDWEDEEELYYGLARDVGD